jgi:hypothetical protein
MAASTKDYDANEIILGPSDLWLDVAVPAASSRLTLDTGTPDTTANPSAFHLGMTEAGCTISYKPEIQDFTSDELTGPHLSRVISEAFTIKGNFLQVFDWDLLAKMTVGGTLGSHTNTSTGYEELTIGGKISLSTFSIALIGPDIADSTKYWVCQLYKTYNKAGIEFTVTRKDQSKVPFEFMGMSVTTRAVNDMIGNFWRQGAPPASA